MVPDILLALDTSTRTMGIALYDGAQILAESAWVTADHHTVELAPAVDETLRRCGLKMSQITALGVATGPGSFTGLRIGLAFAKGIALAQRIPLIGIPSLEIVAAAQPLQEIPLVAVLQAGRTRLGAGWYRAAEGRWQPAGDVLLLTVQTLSERIQEPSAVCGELSGAERALLEQNPHARLASPSQSLRRPAVLAELAWARWQAGQPDNPATLAPTYLHTTDLPAA
jgi:tRNA threonylcarbamoyladenosine biosynthesis protein TsaB